MNLKAVFTKIMAAVFIGFLLVSCLNPFAPRLDDQTTGSGTLLSDRSDVEGVFRNFQYAYSFSDTLIYGELLDPEFIFSYRDYDLGVDVSWGRDEEMKVTNGLFKNSQRLDLVWNNIISITDDSTNIVRSFNLTITFNPTDIVFVDGRVNLDLVKDPDQKWQIKRWQDESNF